MWDIIHGVGGAEEDSPIYKIGTFFSNGFGSQCDNFQKVSSDTFWKTECVQFCVLRSNMII